MFRLRCNSPFILSPHSIIILTWKNIDADLCNKSHIHTERRREKATGVSSRRWMEGGMERGSVPPRPLLPCMEDVVWGRVSGEEQSASGSVWLRETDMDGI